MKELNRLWTTILLMPNWLPGVAQQQPTLLRAVFLASTLFCSGCTTAMPVQASDTPHENPQDKYSSTAAVDLLGDASFAMTVNIPKIVNNSGSVPLDVSVLNDGEATIGYGNQDKGEHVSFSAVLYDAEGHQVPTTDHGERIFGNFGPSTFPGGIHPRESKHWRLDISQCFRTTSGKHYTLGVYFTISSPRDLDVGIRDIPYPMNGE